MLNMSRTLSWLNKGATAARIQVHGSEPPGTDPQNLQIWVFPFIQYSAYPKVSVSGISTDTLVHAFIINRIDYCNSLLFGLPSVHLLKLQRLQNAAARLISNVPRYSHITPVLCSLHWLPVKFRIDLKYFFLLLKPSTIGHAPGYFIDLTATTEQPRYNLRSFQSAAFRDFRNLENKMPHKIYFAAPNGARQKKN